MIGCYSPVRRAQTPAAAGAELDGRNVFGETPLLSAARRINFEAVRLLRRHCAAERVVPRVDQPADRGRRVRGAAECPPAAGLGAALDLALAGVEVTVYERESRVLPDFEPPTLGASAALLGLARRLGLKSVGRADDSGVIDSRRASVSRSRTGQLNWENPRAK